MLLPARYGENRLRVQQFPNLCVNSRIYKKKMLLVAQRGTSKVLTFLREAFQKTAATPLWPKKGQTQKRTSSSRNPIFFINVHAKKKWGEQPTRKTSCQEERIDTRSAALCCSESLVTPCPPARLCHRRWPVIEMSQALTQDGRSFSQ